MESQLQAVRRELKEWERLFALGHGGRKATRDEIKAEPAIAAKYKEYNALSGKARPVRAAAATAAEASPKRRRVDDEIRTPQKARRRSQADDDAVFLEEIVEESQATPTTQRAFIGPTPQKDGRVMGLFDALSPAVASHAVSSPQRTVMGPLDSNSVLATPSKGTCQTLLGVDKTPASVSKHSRTPQSVGRRFLLDKFVTPSKRKRETDESSRQSLALLGPSPQSGSQGAEMRTPAFLRRQSRVAQSGLEPLFEEEMNDDEHEASVAAIAMHSPSKAGQRRRQFMAGRPGFRTSLSRSLSSMIADMRKAEDDQLDEEMELLRDLDNDICSGTENTLSIKVVDDKHKLGPDGASESGASEAESTGAPRRVWKKKGQKRQTRRVILKPVPRLPNLAAVEDRSGREENKIATVSDQTTADGAQEEPSDYSDSDDSDDEARQTKSPSKRRKMVEDERPKGLVEKVRRVAQSAHANFCRLKIRSSKGAAGAKSKARFSRRR